ncbi:6-aminohexanoate-dimer hydrolase [Paenibacillus sp. J23TS9]|uniref:serine hydrolase domain-containing protein n=1 Tax=Paenibacillus sp. J23TS9 TaxID=2807193 RepID=UPI001B0F3CED|nr:serine hydrolase [Paenibacillus sp. J23TS9]GIP28169.1 6-aminohexanoate-dimer hydrolase [Paenibacillus sp. J23TS9]
MENQSMMLYQSPSFRTPPFSYQHPEHAGCNKHLLDKADAEIRRSFPKMRSFLVVRRGHLIYEKYYNGHESGSLNDLRSATKSFTSILTGIAASRSQLPDLDAPLFGILERYTRRQSDPLLQEALTLRRLLTMTTGLAWQTGKKLGEPMIHRFHRSRHWASFALSLPVLPEMVGRFQYRSIDTHLLSVLLTECTGQDAYTYARENVLEPIGIEHAAWLSSPEGHSMGHIGLFLTSRDMAKLGVCCLAGGSWQGQQIISPDWLNQALQTQVEGYPAFGDYGFGWWTGKMNGQTFSCAHGHGGQQIYLFPESEAVIVFTADSKVSRWKNPRPLLQQFILESMD